MDKLVVLIPGQTSERLNNMIKYSLQGYEYEVIRKSENIKNLKNKRLLFAVELGDSGINIELYKMLNTIRLSGNDFLENSVGGILISSNNELFTREVARKIIFYANMAGCLFIGRSVTEATGSLSNFNTLKKVNTNMSLEEICLKASKKTVDRLIKFISLKYKDPQILALHSSNYETSNTLALWQKVKTNLRNCSVKEIHIENGSVKDCKGCPYKECKHYSESSNCFYGGVMVEEVYPAINDCDVLIMLCPNYNDSISANMSAVINRLTALFRKVKFYDKYLYSIIVSGHSGSDILAEQLISALHINKTFMLPPRFALMETANDMGEIERAEGIDEKAKLFAENILANCCG